MWEYNYSIDDELCHYGILGQKWGVRRYQDSSGRLTAEGRKRARQEYKEDNKTAYNLGREATIYGRATATLTKRTIKFENKLSNAVEKDPNFTKNRTKRMLKNDAINRDALMNTAVKAKAAREKAEAHAKSLVDKYGSEAVTPVKYKDINMPKGKYGSPSKISVVNERTNKFSDYAIAGSATIVSGVLTSLMNVPVTMIYYPSTASDKGRLVAAGELETSKRVINEQLRQEKGR